LPPGPRGLPFVGNTLQLLARGANFDQYDAWVQRKYGPIARSRLLGAFSFCICCAILQSAHAPPSKLQAGGCTPSAPLSWHGRCCFPGSRTCTRTDSCRGRWRRQVVPTQAGRDGGRMSCHMSHGLTHLYVICFQCWGNTGIIFANGEAQATNRRLSSPAFFRADILERTHSIILDLTE
jgi:hypothetical protein